MCFSAYSAVRPVATETFVPPYTRQTAVHAAAGRATRYLFYPNITDSDRKVKNFAGYGHSFHLRLVATARLTRLRRAACAFVMLRRQNLPG